MKKQLSEFLEKILTGTEEEIPKKLPKSLKDISLGQKQWGEWYERFRGEKPEGLRLLPLPKKPIKSLPRPMTKQEYDYQVMLYKKGLLKTPPPPFEAPLVSAPDVIDVMPIPKFGTILGTSKEMPIMKTLLQAFMLKKQAEEAARQAKLPIVAPKGWEFVGKGKDIPLWQEIIKKAKEGMPQLPIIVKSGLPQRITRVAPSQVVRGEVVSEAPEGVIKASAQEIGQKTAQEVGKKGILGRALPKVLSGAILGGTGLWLYNLLKDQKQKEQKTQEETPKEKTGKVGGRITKEKEEMKVEEPKLDIGVWKGATFPSLSQAQQQIEQAKEHLEKGNIEDILSAYQSTLGAVAGIRNSYDELKRVVYQGVVEVLTRPLEPPPNLQPSEQEKAVRGITSGLLGLAMAFAPPSKVDFYAGILAGYQDALLSNDEMKKREALELYKINLDRDMRTREMQLQALQTQLQYLQGAEQKDIENVRLQMDYLNTLLDMELRKAEMAMQQAKELQKWMMELYKEQLRHEFRTQEEELKSKLRREEEKEKQKGRRELLRLRQSLRQPKATPNEDLLRLLLGGKNK
jgi:hypothetical protein